MLEVISKNINKNCKGWGNFAFTAVMVSVSWNFISMD